MTVLFDTSALMNLVRREKDRCLDLLEGNAILSLTPYEVGNVLWKEVRLRGTLKPDEAKYVQETLELVFGRMEVIDPSEWERILDLAVKTGITFYDASYVMVAMERDLPLITDDERLARKIKGREFLEKVGKTVKVLSSSELSRLQ